MGAAELCGAPTPGHCRLLGWGIAVVMEELLKVVKEPGMFPSEWASFPGLGGFCTQFLCGEGLPTPIEVLSFCV